ncbi:MAG TPA: vitamin K epoxide reductase family protein [Gemmatimonadales bacterium]|nr:vitamin K epoxide reductase family protein [Gemmatimonadales bacterium]
MKYRMAAAVLALAGVILAAYLYLFKLGFIGTLACGTGSCETVQLSRWSRFLGVEVSLIGLVGYLALLVVAVIATKPGLELVRWPSRWLAIMAGVGTLFALYLTALELFVIHAICRWCVGSAVIITLIFIFSLLDLRRLRGASG